MKVDRGRAVVLSKRRGWTNLSIIQILQCETGDWFNAYSGQPIEIFAVDHDQPEIQVGDLIDVTITRTSCPCDGTQIEFKLISRNVIASQTAKLIASYEELIAKTKEQQIDNLMQIIKRESAALGVEPIVRPHRIKDVL